MELVIHLLDQYSALFLPVAVYMALVFLGAHMPEDSREAISDMMRGRSQSSWTKVYLRWFDSIFDDRMLSFRRLWRSTVASLLSVGILWVVFDALNENSPLRVPVTGSFWQVMALGAALNILPDYISLSQTRWLIKRFSSFKGFAFQVLMLGVDLVLSATIIIAAITAWRLFSGQGLIFPLELVGGFTSLSIFFYSTFVTSLWAWLFALSLLIVRIGQSLWGARLLDMASKPVASLALVSSALSFGVLAVLPVFAPVAKAGEIALCNALKANCGAVYEDRAVTALREFCVGKSKLTCYRNISGYFDRLGAPKSADQLILNGCADGKKLYCQIAALAPGQSVERSMDFLNAAGIECGFGRSCDEAEKRVFDTFIDAFLAYQLDDDWPETSFLCKYSVDWADSYAQLESYLKEFSEIERKLLGEDKTLQTTDAGLREREKEIKASIRELNQSVDAARSSLTELRKTKALSMDLLRGQEKLLESQLKLTVQLNEETQTLRARTKHLARILNNAKARNNIQFCHMEVLIRRSLFATVPVPKT
tara:strand:+ start:358 stop:1971 length:1614 start_codon:yes stop_codon:yes gene_type:complete